MAVPPRPSAPVVLRAGPGDARIGWTVPSATPTVTSLALRWRKAGSTGAYQRRTGLDPAARAAIIDGLDAGTEYTVELSATNTDGSGDWSPAATFTTQEDETVAILQTELTRVAVGIEAAEGTLVAATGRLPYLSGASLVRRVDFAALEEAGDGRAETGDVVTGRGSTLDLPQLLRPEALIPALLCSAAKVASTALSGARRWLFVPSVTGVSGLATATVEITSTDGAAAAHTLDSRFGAARCTAVSVSLDGEIARLDTAWMGRSWEALGSPADPDAIVSEPLPSALFSVSVDDTWAALGTTKIGKVRSGSWTFEPGITEPEGAAAGRQKLDVPYWLRGTLGGGVDLVVDHDEAASGELAHFEAGDLRYVRLEATNGQTGADLRRVRIDTCVRWIDPPDLMAGDGGLHRLSLSGQARADSDDNFMAIEVVCGVESW